MVRRFLPQRLLNLLDAATAKEPSPKLDITCRYQYSRLPNNECFRLLDLHPGSGRLACTLRCERLDQALLSYEALSYAWGTDAAQNSHSIECNGNPLSIGGNLDSGLRHLRHPTQTRSLWVDAICINQENVEELSQQVKRMGDIYAGAKNVIIWVGEDPRGEAAACFSLIQNTVASLTERHLLYGSGKDIPFIRPGDGSVCSSSGEWDLVRRLTRMKWFERVWVLQERGFENEATWKQELPFTRFANKILPGLPFGFNDVLLIGRRYRTSDKRDHVYAFLSHPAAVGQAVQQHALGNIDYSKSVDQIWLETAAFILETDPHPWSLLSSVDHGPSALSCLERPSWVPRWEEANRAVRLGNARWWYLAGGTSSAGFRSLVNLPDRALQVWGILFDIIDWASERFSQKILDLELQKRKKPIQQVWQELEIHRVTTDHCTSGDEEGELAFSKAVVAGNVSGARGAIAEHTGSDENHRLVYKLYKYILNTGPGADEHDVDRLLPETHSFSAAHRIKVSEYVDDQRQFLHNRRVFCTSRGYIGIGSDALRVGDVCVVLLGADVPFVLRKMSEEEMVLDGKDRDRRRQRIETQTQTQRYRLVGECYIEDIMRGEIFVRPQVEEYARFEETEIVIV